MGCAWAAAWGAKVLVGHLDTETTAFAFHEHFLWCESGGPRAYKATCNVSYLLCSSQETGSEKKEAEVISSQARISPDLMLTVCTHRCNPCH